MGRASDHTDKTLQQQASQGSQAAIRTLQRRHNEKVILLVRDELLISTVDARSAVTDAWRKLTSAECIQILPELNDLKGWLVQAASKAADRFIVPGTAAWTRKKGRRRSA